MPRSRSDYPERDEFVQLPRPRGAHRRGRHLLRFLNFTEPTYTTEVIDSRPARWFSYVQPQFHGDRYPPPERLRRREDSAREVRQALDDLETEPRRVSPAPTRHSSAKHRDDELALRKAIDAQNDRISRRLKRRDGEMRDSSGKRVRFVLPREDEVIGRRASVDLDDPRRESLIRCGFCGHVLRD